jgi:hypothetical protein
MVDTEYEAQDGERPGLFVVLLALVVAAVCIALLVFMLTPRTAPRGAPSDKSSWNWIDPADPAHVGMAVLAARRGWDI